MRRSFNMLFQSVQMLDVLNTASAEQLMELHGIGVKRTQAIIETRQEGPFKYYFKIALMIAANCTYTLCMTYHVHVVIAVKAQSSLC
jgi:predicted nucleic acid-binding OB-fold protein